MKKLSPLPALTGLNCFENDFYYVFLASFKMGEVIIQLTFVIFVVFFFCGFQY